MGFAISFCTEVLDPQQPQARIVLFATATAAAATTHSLARHFLHDLKRVRGIVRGVNANPWDGKKLMHYSSCLDAAACEGVTLKLIQILPLFPRVGEILPGLPANVDGQARLLR